MYTEKIEIIVESSSLLSSLLENPVMQLRPAKFRNAWIAHRGRNE
jgi:hypothetical protein